MTIQLINYSHLRQYGILARNSITNTGTTIINDGYWYAPNINGDTLTIGIPPSGFNNSISTNALTELNTFISDITTYTKTLTQCDINSSETDNICFKPNTNYIGTDIHFTSNTIIFDANGDSRAQFFITDTGVGMTFTSVIFVLLNGAKSCNIFWLSNPTSGDGGFTITDPLTYVPGIIISTSNESTCTFTITSENMIGHIYSNSSITFTSNGNVNFFSDTCPVVPIVVPIVCYAKGTLILTNNGFIPIEYIKVGDKVGTKGQIYKNKLIRKEVNFKIERVKWVSKFKVSNLNSKSRPICIQKDAFNKKCPFKDLYVSPCHSLLINGKMVLAKDMVNGTTIYQDNECKNVEYYHLECEKHHAIIANGVLAESYLNVKNRYAFENTKNNNINKIYALK
jgi:hypothetical protein